MDYHLKVFVMVAEKKSFSRAAEELNLTQPAVSQYIRALEYSLGAKLLDRTNKYVRMNQIGEMVYHYAKEILGLYTKMQYLVDERTNKASGPITIGASYTFGEYILPYIIAKLQQSHPSIRPSIIINNTKEIIDLLLSHQLDIGIIEGPLKEKKLTTEIIAEDNMYITAHPDHYLAQTEREPTISELENEGWIMREEGSGTRDAVDEFFRKFQIKPKKYMEFGSTQVIKESVQAGIGISLLSQWAIKKELHHNYMKIVNIKGLPFTRYFSIVTNNTYQTMALKIFIETLHNYPFNPKM